MLNEIIVYSGTTIENYRKCAYINNNGEVLFDKIREPKHAHSRFYFDENFSVALTFGRACAMGFISEHTPLIMRGKVPVDLGYRSLDPNDIFNVNKVYVPKPNIDWHKLDAIFDKNLERHFQELDPEELL